MSDTKRMPVRAEIQLSRFAVNTRRDAFRLGRAIVGHSQFEVVAVKGTWVIRDKEARR